MIHYHCSVSRLIFQSTNQQQALHNCSYQIVYRFHEAGKEFPDVKGRLQDVNRVLLDDFGSPDKEPIK